MLTSRRKFKAVKTVPAVVEPVENRVLFALDVVAQAFNPGTPQLVFTDIQNSSTGGSSATAAQTVTLANSGPGTVAITAASIIDDPAVSGDHTGEFEADGFLSVPFSVTPGSSAQFNVRMRASSTGVKSAILRITTTEGIKDIALRGIGTTSDSAGDVSGSNEPSLQRILNAFRIPVNVGDANGEETFDLPTPRPQGTQHDEVEMQRLRKAGAGPVVIQGLAGFGFNTKTGPVGHFGFYSPGTKDAKTELFAVNVNERSSTNPTWGASFEPAGDFALYGDFNGSIFEINGLPRGVYSEDALNTWDANNKKKVRFFPLKNTDGSTVPNAFVFGFEEFNAGFDSNDIVGIIRNVTAAPAGPEVGTESLDRGLPGPTRLVMNRIQQQPPDPREEEDGTITILPNNAVHDKAKIRVHNTGSSALTISSVVLSNTTDFRLNTTSANGATIQPGSSLDIEVQFIADGPAHVNSGTMTINTNDADEGAITVNLAGYWQLKSENNEEPDLQTAVNQLLGFQTVITNPGEQLAVPGQEGKVARVGEEVLSPYWRRADAARAVEVVQLAALHQHANVANFRWHFRGTQTSNQLFVQRDVDSQSFFPRLNNSDNIAAGTFKPAAQGSDTNPAFGFRVDNEWSDPTFNGQDDQTGGGFGHHIRFWPFRDASGQLVPNTYIMGMDYESINYDYQDNIYIIRNIRPADAVAGPPGAPASLTATGSSAGIALNWADNSEPNLTGYNVYRGATADFTPSASNKLNASGLLTSSEFNDTSAPVGVQQFYKVTAVNDAAQESTASSTSGTRTNDPGPGPDPNAPAAPTNVSATPVSPTAITVTWSASTGATRYTVLRRVAGQGGFAPVADNLTVTSFADSGLAPQTSYEYQVVAGNDAGSSSPSPSATATTPNVGGPGPGPTPAASVSNAQVTEPTSGTANATFTISLDQQSAETIVLNYATADATAGAGDYTPTSGTITFAPGETSKTLDVPILADATDEGNETFVLNVTVASGTAGLGDAQGVGTILSSSAPPPPPSLPFGGKTVATFTGGDGKPVKVALKGPGTGEVTPPDGATGTTISLSGTTERSTIVITGTTTLASVNVNGSLKSFTGKAADLVGDFTISGFLSKLLLRNASGAGNVLTIGAGSPGVSITLGNVADLSVSSASPIKTLRAVAWTDTDSTPDTLTAPSVTSMTVKGDLAADVLVGTLSRLTVGGTMNGSDVRATSDVGTVRTGAIRDSKVFAGVRNDVSSVPDSMDDFTSPATVKSFSVKLKTPGSFSDSIIAASTLGRLSLGAVQTSNGGTQFGVGTGTLASATAVTGGAAKFSVRNVTEPSDSQTEGDFVLRIL